MLRFLSKLRKSQINSVTTRKYFLYAFGEIILVMIGILLALQVNTWNEARKESILEKQYLIRITQDLESDIAYLEDDIKLAKNEIDLYKNFIYNAYNKQGDMQEFATLITSINWSAKNLILQDKTYEELVSTGKANLIKDLNLRNQITDYYRSYEIAQTHIAELNQTAITINLHSEEVTQSLKYWTNNNETIPLKPIMFQEGTWEYINDPASEGFRLLENAACYYAMKNKTKWDYYLNLSHDAKELFISIEDHALN